MERINEILALLADPQGLDAQQLADLEAELLGLFDEAAVDDADADQLAAAEAAAGAIEVIRAENERRAAEASERAAKVADLRGRVAPAEEEPETEVEEAPETEVEAETPPPAKKGEKVKEPVAASADRLAGIAKRQPAAARRNPTPERGGVKVALTAAADIPGIPAGKPLGSMDEVVDAIVRRRTAIKHTPEGVSENVTVATFSYEYPEERRLSRKADPFANAAKILAVCEPRHFTKEPDEHGLVAAGGRCVPLPYDYSLISFGITDRPVRDSLPRFGADRGGIRYIVPPTLADVDMTGADAAIAQWTQQNDADAILPDNPDAEGGAFVSPRKPCSTVACPGDLTAETYAVTRCLEFGNLMSGTFPELIRTFTDLVMVAQARFAEELLIAGIGAVSTAVTSPAVQSVTIDLLNVIERIITNARQRYREADDWTWTALFPRWVLDMMAEDQRRRMPHGDPGAQFEIAKARIRTWLGGLGVRPSFFMDAATTGQRFAGAQGAGAIPAWPTTVVWYMFPEGNFQFLDGGELNLGVVRDSGLNARNSYQLFAETWEGLAHRGLESFQVTSTVCANGTASALATAPTC